MSLFYNVQIIGQKGKGLATEGPSKKTTFLISYKYRVMIYNIIILMKMNREGMKFSKIIGRKPGKIF